MNNFDELKAKLARETAQMQISPAIEAALQKEFDSWRRRRILRRAGALAVAASLLVVFWPARKPVEQSRPRIAEVVRQSLPVPVAHSTPVTHKRKGKPKHAAPPDPEPQFVRIPYSLPLAPYERAEIVRMEMPVSALAAAGIHISTPDTSARAQADLVIGEDGMAKAVRIVSILNNQ